MLIKKGYALITKLFLIRAYRLDGQVILKSCVVNHLMDKKKVDNTKTNKKRVNNTNFKTNLTVQVVCHTKIYLRLRFPESAKQFQKNYPYRFEIY